MTAVTIPIAGFKDVYDVPSVEKALQELSPAASEALRAIYEKMLRLGGQRFTVKPSALPEMESLFEDLPNFAAVLADFDHRVRHIELADAEAFGHLKVIDVPAEAAAHDPWFNATLTSVNDAVVRLGVIDGDFHWHKHDEQDEFFLVLDGELLIDLQGADTLRLGRHQACTVPKGVVHRTRAPRRTTILMVEAAGVMPVGD